MCHNRIYFWLLVAVFAPSLLIGQTPRHINVPHESISEAPTNALRIPFRYRLLGLPFERTDSVSTPIHLRNDSLPQENGIRSFMHGNALPNRFHQQDVTRGKGTQSMQADSSMTSSNELTVAWVQHYASNLVSSSDIPNALATDRFSNVIVTGVSTATFSDGDYLTIKYDPQGNQLWTARAGNPSGGYSVATALAVDPQGNIYVTGFTKNPNVNFDILTIKYDTAGHEQWRATYNGVADSDDIPIAMAVDASGSVYVAGYSYDKDFDYDYLVLKYTPNGIEEWSDRYNGIGNGIDIPTGIAVGNGNVTVTGNADGGSTGSDVVTVRYTTAGVRQWVAIYATAGKDRANALVVDALGNTYVVGSVQADASPTDYLLVKYTPEGIEDWVTTYNGPTNRNDVATGFALGRNGEGYVTGFSEAGNGYPDDVTERIDLQTGAAQWIQRYDNPYHGADIPIGIIVSSEGLIYVSGYSKYNVAADYDFLTLKYDTAGNRFSEVRYNGVGKDDIATSIAADSTGNIFVAGASNAQGLDYAVVKYEANLYGGWFSTFSDGAGTSDASSVATDKSGNVYVAGQSGNNFITIKYNPRGERQWVSQLPQIRGAATALKLDSIGQPCVAGYAIDTMTGYHDFITAKLDTNGSLLWKDIYRGPYGRNDDIVAMAIDGQGNVYVTGRSFSTVTGNDFVTIKYGPDGQTLWIDIFNGELDLDDEPAAIVVDPMQNVIVVGTSIRSLTSSDFTTIKYNPQGYRQWIEYADGTGNGVDRAKAVCVDSQGNVIVTGRSLGIGSGPDYLTVKYSPSGAERWRARLTRGLQTVDEPTAIVSDRMGRIYVTGLSYENYTSIDYGTVQYGASGTELWRSFYNGPANGVDYPVGLVLDASGNIYVTGTSLASGSSTDIATVKYSNAGKELLVDRFNGFASLNDAAHAMTIDTAGNVYIAGNSADQDGRLQALLIKFGRPIQESWPVRYDGPGVSIDRVSNLAVDSSGNVFISGQSTHSNASSYVWTIKYNPQGSVLWNSLSTGSDEWLGSPRAIAVDKSGSAIVTGLSYASFNASSYRTVKYDPNGAQEWSQLYGGSSYNFAVANVVDDSSSVYVTGYSDNATTHYDFATLKYSSDGIQKLVSRFNGPNNNPDDLVYAMKLDAQKNVYLTGLTFDATTGGDYATVKYAPDGTQSWASYYNGPVHSDDRARDLSVDSHGNVYVTGWSVGPDSSYDYLTIKYDSVGAEQWIARYHGQQSEEDQATSIVLDSIGNVYVTGYSTPPPYISSDIITVKYDSLGVEQWERRYDGEAHEVDIANAMLIDRSGYICIAGQSTASDGVLESLVLMYDAEGVLRWVGRYRLPGSLTNEARKMVLDGRGNLFVTGTSAGVAWSVSTTIKYSHSISSAVSSDASVGMHDFALLRNYPNPFNPSATIEVTLAGFAFLTLKVYNMLGQEIATLASHERVSGGVHYIKFEGMNLPSGVYLCRMSAEPMYSSGNKVDGRMFTATTKMLLLR